MSKNRISEKTLNRLTISPTQAGKFDFKLVALLRGGKSTSIRLGGVVDLPAVTVDVERFNFHSGLR